MTVTVQTIRKNNELQCHPTVLEMRNVLSACFDTIINVASGIPSIENILFPEIQKKNYLFPVHRSEKDVSNLIFAD